METQSQVGSLDSNSKSVKFLAGVGIIALLVAAVWLGIQAVQFGSSVTSGLASSLTSVRSLFGQDEGIVLAVDPGVVVSENTFVLSWKQDREVEGSYVLRYECTQGVHLESPASTNNGNVIFCNTPFNFLNTDNQLELNAITVNQGSTEIPIHIEFIPNGKSEAAAMGKTAVTVVDDPALIPDIAGVATSTEPEGTSTTTASSPTTPAPTPPVTRPGETVIVGGNIPTFNDPNGTPDLSIRVLSVGTVSSSGVYTRKTSRLDPRDRLAVKFEVLNNGTKETGPWNFEANLPTERKYTYESNMQESILPGTRIEYTLGFDDAEDDEATITVRIKVDHDNDISESNENNNSANASMNIQT